MTTSFSGKVILVTGAAGGFGSAAARMFSDAGARLVLSDFRADALEAVAASLDGEVRAVSGDVSDPELAGRLVAMCATEFGGLDIAVNNAGIAHDYMPLARTPDEVMRRVIEVDLLGVFYAMKAQLGLMDRQFRDTGRQGAIVNVASVAGVVAAPMLAAYSAAKHGVVGLTKSAAIEHARRGVRINALCPSFARTPMATDMLAKDGEGAEEKLVMAIPMGRLAEVSEVMAGLRFLSDPDNSFVTGQTLHVDGGLSAR